MPRGCPGLGAEYYCTFFVGYFFAPMALSRGTPRANDFGKSHTRIAIEIQICTGWLLLFDFGSACHCAPFSLHVLCVVHVSSSIVLRRPSGCRGLGEEYYSAPLSVVIILYPWPCKAVPHERMISAILTNNM
jgi:hypothetical protein